MYKLIYGLLPRKIVKFIVIIPKVWFNKNMKSDIEKRKKLFKLKLKSRQQKKTLQYINRLEILFSLDIEKLEGNILVNSIEQV